MQAIELNIGAQSDFVNSTSLHTAFFAGRGTGKTLGSAIRGLLFSQQPKIPGQLPPAGCLLADSFPHLRGIVYPALYLLFEMAGMKQGKDWKEVKKQDDRKFVLANGAEIHMRSLDEPDKVRGLNLSWFGVDEGRNFDSAYAYNVLADCLRQGSHPDSDIDESGIWVPGENYKHAGWVTSTPNGFDWMYRLFVGPKKLDSSSFQTASLYENKRHLPASFIRDITARHEGLMYKQEVLGEFVGAVSGAVWPMYDPEKHTSYMPYDPELALYAGWDFGIGDAGVCMFAQMTATQKKLYDGSSVEVPCLRLIGMIEMADKTVEDWANAFWTWLDRNTNGRPPVAMWGDPAGLQRNTVTGTSTIFALGQFGVHVTPAPKRPVDEAIIIVQGLMDRAGGFVIDEEQIRIQQAVQTYRWKVDEEGQRLAPNPVHDWTSHVADALRYLATGVVGLAPRRFAAPREKANPGTMGYIMNQLLDQDKDELSMNSEDEPKSINWSGDEVVGLSGLG